MNLRLLFSTLLVLSVAVLALGDIRADFSTWTPRTGPTPVIRRQGNLPNNFDFIIIGGGTAGSVLANRLSANRKVNVLLIESGTYQTNTLLAEIPVNWDRTPFSPFDHSYLNEGLENELNWNGGQRHVAAGKALGGGTIINTMMWVRGNHLDWDSLGIPGWTFNDVLPYFKKAETTDRFFTAPNGSFWHGHTGPVHVGPSGWQPPEDQRLVDAAASWGLPFNPDWNGATQIGVGFHEHTINNGIRVTSFDSYVLPVLNRNNLWVMDSSEVQKINFRFSGRQIIADSVLFFDNIAGTSYTVRAKKEIILSAGTIRSPQILQLSGIGPASELNRLGIPIIKEIAGVGQNLRDHPITTMSFGTAIPTDVPGSALDQAAFDQWVQNKTGVVASITARTNFFFRSAFAIDARPDAQIIVTPPGTGVFALCYLNKPRSTGHIRLFSKDPSDYPLVTANYMSDPDDLNAMMDIMNKTFQILQQPPIFAFPFGTFLSSKEALQTYILGDAASFVQANVGSGYHFIGTNRMGNIATDPTAVVDNRLRVAGVSSLRVVDASIFPNSPTGNTQYPTYMVAEKASDLILQDWNLL